MDLLRSESMLDMSTGMATVPKDQAASSKKGLPRRGSLVNMSTGKTAVPKDQVTDHKVGLPRGGSLLDMSTGKAAVSQDRSAAAEEEKYEQNSLCDYRRR